MSKNCPRTAVQANCSTSVSSRVPRSLETVQMAGCPYIQPVLDRGETGVDGFVQCVRRMLMELPLDRHNRRLSRYICEIHLIADCED